MTQVDLASAADLRGEERVGRSQKGGGDDEPERVRDGASWSLAGEGRSWAAGWGGEGNWGWGMSRG